MATHLETPKGEKNKVPPSPPSLHQKRILLKKRLLPRTLDFSTMSTSQEEEMIDPGFEEPGSQQKVRQNELERIERENAKL